MFLFPSVAAHNNNKLQSLFTKLSELIIHLLIRSSDYTKSFLSTGLGKFWPQLTVISISLFNLIFFDWKPVI